MADAKGKPALYYPYIHVRSERWLKATLLCVPSVKRIVPSSYLPEDLAAIAKYAEIVGPNGPLLQSVPSDSAAARAAQQQLLLKLRTHKSRIVKKYHQTRNQSVDTYRIHVAKFNEELLEFLVENRLAWSTEHPMAYGHRTWYALQPTLGKAIMTTLGLSISREQNYDIVTPDGEFHEAVLTTKENEIFEKILSGDESGVTATVAQAGHDLSQLVITLTGVNYKALQPEHIPELQSSKHFQKYQRLIANRATCVDLENDVKGYRQSLENQANEIIETWQEIKSDLSKDVRDALFESGLIFSVEALKALHGADIGGLKAAGGIAIGLLVIKGLRIRERRKTGSPHHFLTEIISAENDVLRMTFPLGLDNDD